MSDELLLFLIAFYLLINAALFIYLLGRSDSLAKQVGDLGSRVAVLEAARQAMKPEAQS